MKSSSHNNNQSKKAVVLNQKQRRMNPMAIVIGCTIVVAALVGAYLITDTEETIAHSAIVDKTNTTEVRYPASLFDDGHARHFTHQANGITIRYFVLKSADGVIRAAFDACDVCWPAGKGYFQDGNDMVCRNCGRRFASVRVNEVKGGCNPAPLDRNIENNKLVIKVDDILKGQSYFNFKGV